MQPHTADSGSPVTSTFCNIMKISFLLIIALSISGCTASPAKAFLGESFTLKSVITTMILDQQSSKTPKNAQKQTTEKIISEMQRILPPRTAVVEPCYVISLFTGSAFNSQKMTICMDETGEGYFFKGSGKKVFFYSSLLPTICKEAE